MNKVLTFIACLFLASPAIAQTVGQPPTTSGGGSLTPGTTVITGGTNTRVLFDDNGVLGEDAGNTYNKTTGQLSLTGKTITTSNPVLNLSQTWNSGATFTGILFNATDSGPSAAGSLLMDLQVGSASKFNVRKDGGLTLMGNTNPNLNNISGYFGVMGITGGNGVLIGANGTGASSGYVAFKDSTIATQILTRSTYAWGWSSATDPTSTGDLLLWRDAANTLALRNGPTAQTLRVYGTFTDSSNGDWLSFTKVAGGLATIATVANGTGTQGDLILTAGTNIQVASGKALQLGNAFTSGAVTTTGYITLKDSTGTPYKINACTGC